jgi:hypothetical protein
MIPSAQLRTILLEAVDAGLGLLGVLGRKLTYEVLEERAQLRREEIPQKMELFHRTLQAEILYQKLDIGFTWHPSRTLVDYVNELQQLPRGPHL